MKEYRKPVANYRYLVLSILVLGLVLLACSVAEPLLDTEYEFISTMTIAARQTAMASLPDLVLPASGILQTGDPEDPAVAWVNDGDCISEWRILVYLSERSIQYGKQVRCENSIGDGTREYWDSKTQENPEIYKFPLSSKGYFVSPILYERDYFAHPSSNNTESFSEMVLVGRIYQYNQDIRVTFCFPQYWTRGDLPDVSEVHEILNDDDYYCRNTYNAIFQPLP